METKEAKVKIVSPKHWQEYTTNRLLQIQKQLERKEEYEKCQQIQEELIERIQLISMI